MGKMSITLNSAESSSIYPAVTLGVSAAASGDEVILFFFPSALPALVKGKIKELNRTPDLPDLEEMVDGLVSLGAKFMVCELGLGVNNLKEEDLVDFVEIVGATTFVAEAQGSNLTFSF